MPKKLIKINHKVMKSKTLEPKELVQLLLAKILMKMEVLNLEMKKAGFIQKLKVKDQELEMAIQAKSLEVI